MIKYLLALLALPLSAANISEYEPVGEMQSLSGYTDLSGGAYSSIWGVAYVDNKKGYVDLDTKSCASGGDLEAVEFFETNKVYTVNEAKNGISVINVDTCAVERRFFASVPKTGSDGIEGITVHNGVVYLLDERSSSVYSFIDNGCDRCTIYPDLVFSAPTCVNAGDLAMNGNNIVLVCESRPNIVEYDLTGNFMSSNDLVSFTNTEVIYFTDTQMCAGGEPDQLQCYEVDGIAPPPPPPPTEETCTFSGNVVVTIEDGSFDPQTVTFDCPTIEASGTLQ